MKAPAKDLKGMSFGLLVVKGPGEPKGYHRTWVVQCLCGTIKPVRGDALLSGRTRSCGCASQRFHKSKLEKKFNLANRKFDRLWVIRRIGTVRYGKNQASHALWECKCDCGKIVKVPGRALRSGATRSCGCILLEAAMRGLAQRQQQQQLVGA